MEVAALVVSFVSPFIPHLIKMGKPVAEEAGKKLGEKVGEGSWEKVKEVWSKLFPKLSEKPMAKGAAEELASNPEDEDAKEVLLKQVEKLVKSDASLAQELQQLLEDSQATVANVVNITQSVQGDKNIVFGKSSGSISITNN